MNTIWKLMCHLTDSKCGKCQFFRYFRDPQIQQSFYRLLPLHLENYLCFYNRGMEKWPRSYVYHQICTELINSKFKRTD